MSGSEWWRVFLDGDYGQSLGGPETAVFILLFAFVVGQFVGWVYMWTHSGLSYSQSYVVSLAVLPVLVALMMMMMSGSVLIAFGMFAVFAVVRFRNVLKDTRDTMFILWAIIEGLGVGTMRYSTAAIAAVGVALVLGYLRLTAFGRRNRHDAILAVQLNGDLVALQSTLKQILGVYCDRLHLSSQQQSAADSMHISYRVLLRDPGRCNEMRDMLQNAGGIEDVNLFLSQDEAEI